MENDNIEILERAQELLVDARHRHDAAFAIMDVTDGLLETAEAKLHALVDVPEKLAQDFEGVKTWAVTARDAHDEAWRKMDFIVGHIQTLVNRVASLTDLFKESTYGC